jgi:putative membrane protein
MDELDQPRPSRPRYLISKLWKVLLGYWLYARVATWIEVTYLGEDVTVSNDLETVATLFLGILMALRINTALSKWWEARTLWGRLINEERNLAAYAATLGGVPPEARERLRGLLTEFPVALMRHLRAPGAVHQPARVAGQIMAELHLWKEKGWVDGWEWSRLALVSESFLQVCGGCERIRNSPLIATLRRSGRACGWMYMASAPLALHCRPWTIPLVLMLSVLFFVLERTAADIDEPFGTAPEDLPMETMCKGIAATVGQILAPPVAPLGEAGS